MAVDVRSIIEQTWTRRGVDPRAGQVIAQLESGFDPSAKNPNSSAEGLFQFIDSTAGDYGLTDRRNPWQSSDAGARLASDNASALSQALGRPPTTGELYLAHQQGAGGATRLLSNPNARAVDIVGADAVRLNGGNENMTAGEFASLWIRKAERAERDLFGGGPEQVYLAGGQGGPLTTDQTQIANIYNAYASGQMSPEDMAEYEAAVASGAIGVPDGAQVGQSEQQAQPLTTDPNVALNVYSAYASGQMDENEAAEYIAAVQSGAMPTPGKSQVTPEMEAAAGIPLPDDMLPGGDGPAPIASPQGSIAGELAGPMLSGANQAIEGALGRGPSMTGQLLGDTPENPPGWFGRNVTNRVGDLGLAALQGIGGAMAGAAGGVGDAAEGLGMGRGDAERLGRDLAAMPEAFAASAGTLARPSIPRVQSNAQVARSGRVADADAAIAAGAERGVRVMTSDALPPQTFASRWTQSIGEKIPVTGTGAPRSAQFAERQAAIEDVVRMYAPEGAVVDDILPLLSDDLVRANSEFVSRYNGMKTEVIDRLSSAGQVDVSRTVRAIDQEIARLNGMNNQSVAPVIARLEDWKTSVQGQNLGGVEELRRLLGESFKSPDMAAVKSVGEASLNRIYGPLREDMGDFIRANGERRDVTRWGVANARLSENIQEVHGTALRAALRDAETKPETVRRLLFSQNRSDVSRIYRRLSPEGKQNARAAVLLEALEKSNPQGLLSPTRFASNIDRLGRQTGVVFTGEDRRVMEGLGRVLRSTQRADQAAMNPPTGAQNVPFIGGAVLTDLLGGMGAAVGTTGGIGAAARAYESPAMRNTLLAISRARSGSAQEASLISRYEEMLKSGAIAGIVTGGPDGVQ